MTHQTYMIVNDNKHVGSISKEIDPSGLKWIVNHQGGSFIFFGSLIQLEDELKNMGYFIPLQIRTLLLRGKK